MSPDATNTGFAAGDVIADQYEIEELLGEGGMGQVYRARQRNLDREVALKVLLPGSYSDADAKVRFLREAKVASAVKHPNVVQIYDVGEDDGRVFLAMEFLHGTNLRELVGDGRAVSLPDALTIAGQLAGALVAAHKQSVVHRDLKPENIFLEQTADGSVRVVVVDFGLAFIEGDRERGRMTRDGLVVGTPDYLSPEQADGRHIGPAADIYAFGCVLYEMLTGITPFVGSTLNILTQHLHVAPVPPSRRVEGLVLPRDLETMILSMLAKRPEDRPQIAEVIRSLSSAENTLAGKRNRGRDASYLEDRSARMVSVAYTQPHDIRPAPITSEAAEVRLGVFGQLPDDVVFGLPSNRIEKRDCTTAEDAGECDIVIVTTEDTSLVERLVGDGHVVLASARGEDMQTVSALARAGAAEIVTHPIVINDVVRKLTRARKRAKRHQTKS